MSFSRQLRRKRKFPFGDGHSVKIDVYNIGNFTRATITCENCSCRYEAKYESMDGSQKRNKNVGTDIALRRAREEFLKLSSCNRQRKLDTAQKVMTS